MYRPEWRKQSEKGNGPMKTRVIVCGCRDFCNQDFCFRILDEILGEYDDPEIVSGHAKGADACGEAYARLRSLPLKVFPAEWDKYGRAAGPIRNKQMLLYALEAKPLVIAFWDGLSRGTKNMISQAEKADVEVRIVRI